MGAPQSFPPAYTESLGTKLDKVADALTGGHVKLHADGVSVDVKADGHVIAVHIDDEVIPGGRGLGPLITQLLNSARAQAQAEVDSLVREAWSDPRVQDVVERIGDAPERAVPQTADPVAGSTDRDRYDYGFDDPDNEDYHPLQPKSRIAD